MVSDLAARDALVAQLDAFEETRAALETELREKEGLLTSARAARRRRRARLRPRRAWRSRR